MKNRLFYFAACVALVLSSVAAVTMVKKKMQIFP